MERREMLRQSYEDALLALLMEDIAESEGERFEREAAALPDTPAELDRRCLRAIRASRAGKRARRVARRAYNLVSKAAVAALIAVVLVTGAFAAFPQLEVGTKNMMIVVRDVATTLFFGEEEQSLPEDTTGFLKGWTFPVPEEFELVDSDESVYSSYLHYSDGESELSLEVRLIMDGLSTSINTENALSVDYITIHGMDAMLVCHEEVTMLVIVDAEHSLLISMYAEGMGKNSVLNIALGGVYEDT